MPKCGTMWFVLTVIVGLSVAACASLVSPYDATFDQSLNKLSEDTAKFLAAASAGAVERQAQSKEATAYYAGTYNLLDRISQRASLARGSVPCPTNSNHESLASLPTSKTTLPEDHMKFDCREFQLYAVRLYVDQLNYGHKQDGTLNASEIRALGGVLQASIMGAIQTFLINKPTQ